MNFEKDLHLENDHALLRPLKPQDLEHLQTIAIDPDIWRYMTISVNSQQDLQRWADTAFSDREKQQRYTFLIIDKSTGKLAGSTAYGNISTVDQRLEIGWTWLGNEARGTGLNRHCKFLLLQYAFEILHYERVELKTDVLNLRSRQAMRKIGATEEGILRSHTLMQDGRRRDTIYYSILKSEWPNLKATVFADLRSFSTQA